jgi:hypothetical protein
VGYGGKRQAYLSRRDQRDDLKREQSIVVTQMYREKEWFI